ncbi:hypothetical protein [Nostoc sp. FACHB-190]|uniref:hypothetical protein n=1 Tax=Nostoc sp. FACHB-190 TaxID=2692838 RepID=UPI001687606A|nr:hypothetical protein [Nostoc sp. FACHB-190]MBD2298703.1 hypothetical protein [Nostoc sp. FACHB-190]
MEKMNKSEANPVGAKLFTDAESFLEDLGDTAAMAVQGGEGAFFLPYIAYGQKFLEYGVNGFAINNIASIAKSFSGAGVGAAGVGNGDDTGGAGNSGVGGAGNGGVGNGGSAGGVSSAPGLSGTITYKL